MCTWNRKHNDWPGCSESEQPISTAQEQEVSDTTKTTEEAPEEHLLDSLKHFHI